MRQRSTGFTIVELLIVIIVIAVLAVIVVVAFNGVQNRARESANVSSLQSASRQIKNFQTTNGTYPQTLASANISSTNGISYRYTANNDVSPQTFCLEATNGSVVTYISQDASATAMSCLPAINQATVASSSGNSTSYLGSMSASVSYAVGDVVYILAGSGSGGTSFTAPSGYTQVATATSIGTVNRISLYRKVATDSDSAGTVTVSRGGSGYWSMAVFVIRGADTTSPEDSAITNYRPAPASGTVSFTSSATSASRTGGLAIIGVVTNGATAIEAPATLARGTTYAAFGYHQLQYLLSSEPYQVTTTRSGSIDTVGISFVVRSGS